MKHLLAYRLTPLSLAALALVAGLGAAAHAQDGAGPRWRMVLVSGARAQGYLGVDFHDISQDQVSTLRLKDNRGVEVVMLDHDGPACKAGLREHDVILQMDGVTIESEDQLRRALHESTPGRKLSLLISRDGQQQTMHVVLANRSEIERKAWSQHFVVPDPGLDQPAGSRREESSLARFGDKFLPNPAVILGMPRIGVTLDPMEPQLAEFFGSPNGKGLLVRTVEPNSAAERSGMKAGDVVLKVNGTVVTSRNDWLRALHEGKSKPVAVTILREKKEQTLTVNMDDKKKSEVEEGKPRHALLMQFVP
ncbi:PDZ domain-containing protein [Terriglobus tenax]|uniref:PDZ domain-containing protein n=1 Tax=Terriglobus tenax TaxID=1111115 RepID=UPI0021E0D9C4|nr:PDZ domain-containing protein [Terriglobus tenax]